MGIVVKTIHELFDVLMGHGVPDNVMAPFVQLFLGGESAMQNEVGGLQIGALFGQLFDGIAAIAQNAFVAVDEGYPALTRGGVHKRRIVTHQAEVFVRYLDLPQVRRANRCAIERVGAVGNRYLVALACAVVDQGNAVLCHDLPPNIECAQILGPP
jgi:hypothetical protein